jgi:diaminopimelate decarboxylase
MDHFSYRQGELRCEGVSLRALADAVGTPAYVYSRAALHDAFTGYQRAFRDVPHIVCYAVKANSTLAVLATLAGLGAGADIVSGGELFRALRAGVPPKRIIFSGVGKTREEMQEALKAEILMFNVESRSELDALDEVAGALGVRAPVALRVNPDVDPQTHPYIATGLRTSKFGIAIAEALDVYQEAARRKNLEVIGVDMHIGSQLTKTTPFADAGARLAGLVGALRARGLAVSYLDIGGGLGIRYRDEVPPSAEDYARAVVPLLKELGVTVLLEPGRSIVGNAGVLLSRVLYRKDAAEKRFVVVDAAMNDLIRPALYSAYHEIRPVAEARLAAPVEKVDVVGPICESGDFLAKDRELPRLEEGDLVAVMSAGAYTTVMASNYNTRPRAVEVLVDGDRYTIVRRRETYEDLVAGEAGS